MTWHLSAPLHMGELHWFSHSLNQILIAMAFNSYQNCIGKIMLATAKTLACSPTGLLIILWNRIKNFWCLCFFDWLCMRFWFIVWRYWFHLLYAHKYFLLKANTSDQSKDRRRQPALWLAVEHLQVHGEDQTCPHLRPVLVGPHSCAWRMLFHSWLLFSSHASARFWDQLNAIH